MGSLAVRAEWVQASPLRRLGRAVQAAAGPCPARAATTAAGAAAPGRAPSPSSWVLVTGSPSPSRALPGVRNGRVPHQLENSREGPALQPPRSREAEGILQIRQYYIASHCWEIFILAMELLLPSPPRRSRGLPVTPHLGARSSPAGHLLLPVPRSPGTAPTLGARRAAGICGSRWGHGARNTASPLPPPSKGSSPDGAGGAPSEVHGSYLRRRSGGAGTSRSKPNRAEPSRTELK